MENISLPVLNIEGKEVGRIDLPADIFGTKVNTALIYQAVVMYRASLRQGNVSTKERAYVSGGGAKPYRQKGTGRARVGSNRSPLWIGGGTVFGPHPRDFGYSLPKKIRRAALRESLKAKIKDDEFICIEEIKNVEKTKQFVRILDAVGTRGRVLGLLDGSDDTVDRASRNIKRFKLLRSADVNAYDLLQYKTVLVTKTAVDNLIKRILHKVNNSENN